MLVGREKELAFLNRYYMQSGSKICVIYGQKGVGKTALLRYFAKEAGSCFYYKARSCSEREQCFQWREELTGLGYDLPNMPGFDMLLEASRLASGKQVDKHIIIIDEFQNLIKNESVFMQKLMEFLHYHQSNLPCMVLLCSSASGWIENNMLGKIGNFAGAINGLLKVKELKFQDMRKLYRDFSVEDCLLAYAVLGGYPGLWNCLDSHKSVKESLIEQFISKRGSLFSKISGYMADELRETAVYNTILVALSQGENKLNDIYHRTMFSRAKISVYMKNLMELDLVKKVYSVETAGYRNTQKGVYKISMPCISFYYKYLFSNYSALNILEEREFYEKYVEEGLKEELERAYCKICKELIGSQYPSVTEWNGKNGDIPIIAEDENQRLTVCFCSYGEPFTVKDFEKYQLLLRKARIQASTIILFSESDFLPELLEKTKNLPVLYQSMIHRGER